MNTHFPDQDSIDQLEQLLRDEAPTPRAAFIAELDRKVANDFRPEQQPSAISRALGTLRNRWVLTGSLATGTCALVLVAVLALTADTQTNDYSSTTAPDTGGASAPSEAPTSTMEQDTEASAGATADMATDPRAATAVPPSGGSSTSIEATKGTAKSTAGRYANERDHIVGLGIFLEVPRKEVPDTIASATTIADKLGGYTTDSTFDLNTTFATGSAELWVPTKQYAVAVARLSRLGDVQRTVQNSDDVTEPRTTLADVIKQDEARLKGLTGAERRALQAQIDQRKERLGNIDSQIAMTQIDLRVTGVDKRKQAEEPAEEWSIAWAIDESGDLLSGLAAGAIIVGAVLLLPALLIAAIWGSLVLRRRARRNRTLDDE